MVDVEARGRQSPKGGGDREKGHGQDVVTVCVTRRKKKKRWKEKTGTQKKEQKGEGAVAHFNSTICSYAKPTQETDGVCAGASDLQ